VKQLSRDGASWISAEAELAQAELAQASKRAITALALAIAAAAAALATLIVIAFVAVALLAPQIGEIGATAAVAVAFLLLTVILGWSAYRIAVSTADVASFIKRRLNVFRGITP
jgi:hypothetical protein